ncbi:MAG: hypothetical protein ACE366_00395 [Bradymonadia bacterium]
MRHWGTGIEGDLEGDLIALGIGILLLIAGTGVKLWQYYIMRKAAQAVDFSASSVGPGLFSEMDGKLHGLRVMVRVKRSAWFFPETVITALGLPKNLRVHPAGLQSRLNDLMDGDRVLTGDDVFDQKVWLAGDEAALRGGLTEQARAALSKAMSTHPFMVEDGTLTATISGLPLSSGGIVSILKALDDALPHLKALEEARPELLSRQALRDPDTDVRRAALTQLLHRFPEDPLATTTLEKVMESAPSGDQVAALELAFDGRMGQSFWPKLCTLLMSTRLKQDTRLQALVIFSAHMSMVVSPDPRPSAVLASLLSEPFPLVEAVQLAGRRVFPDIRAPLMGLEASSTALKLAQVQALSTYAGDTYDDALQQLLVERLADEEREVQVAAAHVLRDHADVSAVAPLQALLSSGIKGVLVSGEIKRVVEEAVSAIQGRLGEGAAHAVGGLTLEALKEKSGGLSEATEGRLSIAKPEKSQPT